MVLVQMERYSESHWDVWHAFIHGWASHARCKVRVYLHVSVWHMSWPLLPSVAPIMAPVPLHVSLIIIAPSRKSLLVEVLEGNKAGKLPYII